MHFLHGTGVAIVTPFTTNDSVDFNALESLIDYLIQNGVNYLVALGTTGETPVLSKEEKNDIILCTYEKVAGRVPVIVGVGGNDTRSVVNDLSTYPLDKAAAILSASPYYNKPSQDGLLAHYRMLSENSPKPIILYNVPGRTGRNMTAATTVELAKSCENIIAIKEASGDMQQCMDILRLAPETFIVVSGDDNLVIPQIACGMKGVISVAANAYPHAFSSMVNHCLNGDFSSAKNINDSLMDAYQMMFEENNPAGVKCFLHAIGRMEDTVRLPLTSVSQPLKQKITSWVNENHGLIKP
jgi:4-hydroxy-tetrahydrodipicolinate synthase